ncbi:MAG: hypothetical protein K6B41_04675 [Butyrivibrio sp.]|nr:hypothetical protein [Butyrivibrio sp.]
MEECMKVLDRIMDQVYNHPEEMRKRILKNSTAYISNQENKSQNNSEMLTTV